jgi:hypothetical protein
MQRDRALVCAEVHELAVDRSTSDHSQSGILYLLAKWPKQVDPETAIAYLKDGVVTLTAKNVSP